MKDNVEFNIRFIELIKERPCIYDHTRCDYSNKTTQDVAWKEISKIVNESVPDCKERWKNLRGCYTRHLKKREAVWNPSGRRIKPYYLSNNLSFLDNFTKSREGKDKIKTEDMESETDPENSNDNMDNESETASPAHSVMEKKEILIENPEHPAVNKIKIKKPRHVYVNDTNGSETEYFQQSQDGPENQDPDFAFLYSVLPDMHEMNREQKRKFKMGIIKLAGDILQEDVSGPCASGN